MDSERDDIELISCYRRGDAGALDELVKRYQRQLFGYIVKMTGSAADADEIFQETWYKVIRKLRLYRHNNFMGWLVRITHNVIVDRSRRKKPNVSLDRETESGDSMLSVLPDKGPGPMERVANLDVKKRIDAAVAELPEDQREVFLLRTEAGLSFKEIAVIQKTSINTALARMQYALSKLREPLREVYDEL
jgi:RNA polymerase sigma-70 factor (ECF subfamily)